MLESPLLRSQEKHVRTLVTTNEMRTLCDGRIDATFVSLLEVDTPSRCCSSLEKRRVSRVSASTIAAELPGGVHQPLTRRPCNIEPALIVARGQASPSVRQLVCLATGAADNRCARTA